MTTGQAYGAQWSGGTRNWAQFMEPHYYPLYEAIYYQLGVGDGKRLLDVGCGPGGAALFAAKRGARIAGLDASPDSVAVAHERIPTGEFQVGDMEHLPWPDSSFDAVTGFNSFSFAGNPVAALREARRVLIAGGKVAIVVFAPREESQQPKLMAALAALAPPQTPGGPGPFALSTPGALAPVVKTAGLRVVGQGASVVVLAYATAEDACRAFLAGGTGLQALQHSGEARVLQALREALEEFRAATGGYRIENHFRWMIAVWAAQGASGVEESIELRGHDQYVMLWMRNVHSYEMLLDEGRALEERLTYFARRCLGPASVGVLHIRTARQGSGTGADA